MVVVVVVVHLLLGCVGVDWLVVADSKRETPPKRLCGTS